MSIFDRQQFCIGSFLAWQAPYGVKQIYLLQDREYGAILTQF
jgi:hypothetical protein